MSSQRVGHGVLEGSDHKVSLGLLSSQLHGEKKKKEKPKAKLLFGDGTT